MGKTDCKEIRILIVEDSEDDALLIVREIQHGGYTVLMARVDSELTMKTALGEKTWDLVIADHNLPGFDSKRALEIVRQFNPNMPFILVSGSIGEEVAVDAMKSGAHDYVMKCNLARLLPAVERELREAENRRAHQKAEALIRHMAFHDSLTGLINRVRFEQGLNEAVMEANEEGNIHALLYLDLDQFKVINDTCGHLAGDELLRRLAQQLQRKIRDSDALARLGGDEFGILLRHCPLQRAEQIAQTLLQSIQSYQFIWENRHFKVGASIGVVPIEGNGNAQTLLSLADMACYAAKDQGRNRVHVYTEGDKLITQRFGEMHWLQRLRAAVENDSLVLFQQQILPLQVGNPHYELLLRMEDEEHHLITPDYFIPAAERYNFMAEVDRWVIRHTCEQIQHQQLLTGNQATIAAYFINLSANSLSDASLINYIQRQLNSHGIPPQCIGFEITETAAIADLENALELIQALRKMGCKVALDDFGTGMTSFSYLKSLTVDYIKIDGSFVQAMLENEIDKAIVESVNTICHIAGMQTVAEFVESEAILQNLTVMGVDYAQGWAIHYPSLFTKQGKHLLPHCL
ncbi:MAG: hypothetical protein AXA67_12490 [Methylothermaceae bacteria B42]|nr:MAG: hypothetical protein AXA67_12490 [Methylothermaceae bacteria B42]HHJ37971.1 EAL domain-containing protein [Methylothermaceae bacterium]